VWLRWVEGVPVALLALALLLVLADVALSAGRIHPGVDIGPVSVGGMSTERAAEHVSDELGPRLDEPVSVTFQNREWEVTAEEVSASLDPDGYASEAYDIGRTGSLWRRVRDRVTLWVDGAVVEPYVVAETTATAALLDALDEEIGEEPVDAAIEIDGTTPVLIPATVGLAVDRELAEREILRAFVSEERSVDLPTRLLPVAITDADAQDALEAARSMLSGPLLIEYEDASWSILPAEIAGWIVFEKVPYASEETTASVATTPSASEEATAAELPGRMMLQADLDAEEVSATILPLTEGVGRPARDAEFRASAGRVSIVPAEVGLGVDVEALVDTLSMVLLKDDPEDRVTVLRMQALQPELTTEEAEAMGISERLATFTTTFSSSNAPRVNNIQTLAEALDGTLIAPGDTFSFNDAVGARTAEKGYEEAGTIVNGRLVPTLGGGICQVCTTLFNTVFFAGLPVERRSNHSFYISSYPTGRDATVSWGGPDFEFSNDTSAWLLVATGWSSSSVTISLYGTDPGYEVEYTTGPFTDVKPHSTKTVEDDTLDEGVRVVEEGGVDGRTVVVTRTVYRDGSVVREDTFRSKYNPKQEIVRIGTRPISKSTPTTQTSGN
jgi:vancomycin resistance protein YoaR